VVHLHRLIRKALQQAVVWQFRASNAADAIDAPRVPEREIQPIDEERAVTLIEAADGTDMFAILIGLCTGMRRGEILALRWSDVDLGRAKITISIPPVLVEVFVDHREKQEAAKELFGPTTRI
jgi:integrase